VKYLWDEKARELREAVKKAHEACMRAAAENNTIMRDVPSGLPHPDGTQRISNPARAERNALDAYVHAMRVFNDYVNQKPKTF